MYIESGAAKKNARSCASECSPPMTPKRTAAYNDHGIRSLWCRSRACEDPTFGENSKSRDGKGMLSNGFPRNGLLRNGSMIPWRTLLNIDTLRSFGRSSASDSGRCGLKIEKWRSILSTNSAFNPDDDKPSPLQRERRSLTFKRFIMSANFSLLRREQMSIGERKFNNFFKFKHLELHFFRLRS